MHFRQLNLRIKLSFLPDKFYILIILNHIFYVKRIVIVKSVKKHYPATYTFMSLCIKSNENIMCT